MKRYLFIYSLLLLTFSGFSQIEFGIKAGLNSMDLITNSIQIPNEFGVKEIRFKDSKYGHHFGLYTRIKILGVYIEPAAMFNSNTVSYSIDDYSEAEAVSIIRNEKYNKLDLPVMVGLKAGIVRLYAGPVAHLHISSRSDLVDIPSYSQKFRAATYGYQAGFGLDIWKLRFDIGYEGNLNKFGDHIHIGDEQFSFDNSAARILATVGYAF